MVNTLRAVNFRCWTELDLEMPTTGGIFVGQNAQGKTSILEAVCLLMRLQSPRTHKMASMIQVNSSQWGVVGEMSQSKRKVVYGASGILLEVDEEMRAGSSDYLADSGLVVWMGNEDLELIRGSGEIRRRYLDFMGAQWDPEYRRHWSRYRRAVKMKSVLLKERYPDEKQIAAIEEIMIISGEAIAQLRVSMVEILQGFAAEAQRAVSHADESLQIEYRPAGSLTMRASLTMAHERERRTRQCVVGPHRDDLELQLNSLDAAEFASEGQQRTTALALKLAQGKMLEQRTGRLPIYLLDDIFGELDRVRRNSLMRSLPEHAQKWITTTSLDWLQEDESYLALKQFEVAGGKILS